MDFAYYGLECLFRDVLDARISQSVRYRRLNGQVY